MKTKLICFIGTDGSGKSTASEMLVYYFKNADEKCKCTWGAYDLWLLKPLIKTAKKIFMKHSLPDQDYKKYRKDMEKASKKGILVKLYRMLIFSEYWFEILFKVKLPLLMGYNVICDRYVFDTVINIASNSGINMEEFGLMLCRWLKFFPKPDLVIYVATPPEVSMQRKDDIPHIDYIKQRIPYYEELASSRSMVKIDGSKPLIEIKIQIQNIYNNIKEK